MRRQPHAMTWYRHHHVLIAIDSKTLSTADDGGAAILRRIRSPVPHFIHILVCGWLYRSTDLINHAHDGRYRFCPEEMPRLRGPVRRVHGPHALRPSPTTMPCPSSRGDGLCLGDTLQDVDYQHEEQYGRGASIDH
jgi:hypothetical protein